MSDAPPKDFGFGEDEAMLRDLARSFLGERFPIETLRDLVCKDSDAVYERGERQAWDEALWKEIVELGWTGLAIPEAAGGVGFKQAGIVGLVEEIGRHALPSPLVSTLNASYVLREAEGPGTELWMNRIAAGATASLAITDSRGSWEPADGEITARRDGDDLVLDGGAFFVQDAFKSDFFLTAAQIGDDRVLCAVPAESKGLDLSQDHIHDLTRDQATLHLQEVRVPPENVISTAGEAALLRAWPSILVTVAADLCGCAEWQLQATVEYAKDRKQFDRPIGFFQAVKHPLVNAMMDIDQARSLIYRAASFIDMGDPSSLDAARMAKSAASDAGAFISDRSVQLHGGIGFTWESDVHIFFKRSMHNQSLYGDGVYQRCKIAETMIGPLGK
jgi:alkylation response protein AidB-like acyl-CoA dehydrogenase